MNDMCLKNYVISATRVLALFSAFCLSLSCGKETPVVDSDERSSSLPLEERILIEASATHYINGYTETGSIITFLLSEPFHVASLSRDVETVALERKYLSSMREDPEGIHLVFVDKKTVFLRYQGEVALAFKTSFDTPLTAYPGGSRELPFVVTKAGRGTLDVKVSTEGAVSASCVFDSDNRSGVLSLAFPDEEDAAGGLTMTLTDGIHSSTTALEVKTFRLEVSAEPVLLSYTVGSKALLSYRVETDIPECKLVFTPASGAFFTMEGEYLVVQEDNPAPERRESFLTISEQSGKMRSFQVAVSQKGTPADPGECPVEIPDEALKKALVSVADVDGDSEVSFNEALSVRELDISGHGISDLTGLEAFQNVWKLDARNNNIEDGTIVSSLPGLYWLDLKGNRNLETFDVTGCSLYFEHCEFEITQSLVYFTTRNQIGVTNSSDPSCLHSRHVEDPRQTVGWAGQDELVLMQRHTEGKGYPVVFTGITYLDVDMQDGSFERLMRSAMDLMLKNYLGMDEHAKYLDIYCLKHRAFSRNEYYLNDSECSYDNPRCVETYERFFSDEAALLKSAYQSLSGDEVEEMGMLSFLVECAPSCHPGRFAATFNFTGYYDGQDPFRYGPLVSYFFHRGMDDTDESVYGGLSSQTLEELFKNVPSGEDYKAFLKDIEKR